MFRLKHVLIRAVINTAIGSVSMANTCEPGDRAAMQMIMHHVDEDHLAGSPEFHRQPVVGYVATGLVTVRIGEGAAQVIEEGKSFYAPGGVTTQISAKNGEAKVVTFQLRS